MNSIGSSLFDGVQDLLHDQVGLPEEEHDGGRQNDTEKQGFIWIWAVHASFQKWLAVLEAFEMLVNDTIVKIWGQS